MVGDKVTIKILFNDNLDTKQYNNYLKTKVPWNMDLNNIRLFEYNYSWSYVYTYTILYTMVKKKKITIIVDILLYSIVYIYI